MWPPKFTEPGYVNVGAARMRKTVIEPDSETGEGAKPSLHVTALRVMLCCSFRFAFKVAVGVFIPEVQLGVAPFDVQDTIPPGVPGLICIVTERLFDGIVNE